VLNSGSSRFVVLQCVSSPVCRAQPLGEVRAGVAQGTPFELVGGPCVTGDLPAPCVVSFSGGRPAGFWHS
jgi:hypothetical protein